MTHNRLISIAAVLALLPAPHPRQYRFTMEYFNFDAKGQFLQTWCGKARSRGSR